jgi:hypothetical protein
LPRMAALLIGLSATVGPGCLRAKSFDIEIVRDGAAYDVVEDCRGDQPHAGKALHIPVGTRLTVVGTDWGGKHWPCFEARYRGERVFLTSDLFK